MVSKEAPGVHGRAKRNVRYVEEKVMKRGERGELSYLVLARGQTSKMGGKKTKLLLHIFSSGEFASNGWVTPLIGHARELRRDFHILPGFISLYHSGEVLVREVPRLFPENTVVTAIIFNLSTRQKFSSSFTTLKQKGGD